MRPPLSMRKIHAIAHARLKDGEAFRMVFWPQEHHARMSDGDFIRALEDRARGYSAPVAAADRTAYAPGMSRPEEAC